MSLGPGKIEAYHPGRPATVIVTMALLALWISKIAGQMPTEVTDPSANPLKVDEAHFAQLEAVVSNKRGVVKKLRALRLNGTDFYVTDRRENTLLHVAADADNINAARYLLKRGILKEHINHRNIGFYIDRQTNRSGHEELDTPLHRLFPPNIDVTRKPNYSFANLLLKEGADPRIKNVATGDLFYSHVILPRRTQNLKDASGQRAALEESKLKQAKARLKKAEEMEREKKRFKEVVNPDGKVMMGKVVGTR